MENTHEPLISLDVWKQVRRLEAQNIRRRTTDDGSPSLFSGILFVWIAVAVCVTTRMGERKNTVLHPRIKAMLAVYILRAANRSVRLTFSISE